MEPAELRNLYRQGYVERFERIPPWRECLLQAAGLRLVHGLVIPHDNVLRVVHPISHIPGLRELFSARLFREARA